MTREPFPRTPDEEVAGHVAPVAGVTWVAADGLRYLAAEIVLHLKARLGRPKDDLDLARRLPLLDDDRRSRLRDAVRRTEPGHRRLAVLDADRP